MVGFVLRMYFDMMTETLKTELRTICEKYNVRPECIYPGGEVESMIFEFGDDTERSKLFGAELETILGIKSRGRKRRTTGHRIQCPL